MHSTCHGALPAVSAVLVSTVSIRAFLRRQAGDWSILEVDTL